MRAAPDEPASAGKSNDTSVRAIGYLPVTCTHDMNTWRRRSRRIQSFIPASSELMSSACSSSTARISSIIRLVVESLPCSHCDDLAVAFDRDPLGDEVFAQHVDERRPFDVFGVAPLRQRVRIQIGLAAQLHDALRDPIGMLLLLGRVLGELLLDRFRRDALGHEIVPLVAQHAHDLGRERLVQHLAHDLRGRRRSSTSRRPASMCCRARCAQRRDVGQERRCLARVDCSPSLTPQRRDISRPTIAPAAAA